MKTQQWIQWFSHILCYCYPKYASLIEKKKKKKKNQTAGGRATASTQRKHPIRMRHPSPEYKTYIHIDIHTYIHIMTLCPQEINAWIWGPREEIWDHLTVITPGESHEEFRLPVSQFWAEKSWLPKEEDIYKVKQHKSWQSLSCYYGPGTLGFTWERTSRQEVIRLGRGNWTWSLGRGKYTII